MVEIQDLRNEKPNSIAAACAIDAAHDPSQYVRRTFGSCLYPMDMARARRFVLSVERDGEQPVCAYLQPYGVTVYIKAGNK